MEEFVRPKLKVGDHVRLHRKFNQFKKSYLPSWTEEVFVVARVMSGVVPTYKIHEWDGTPIKGTFYAKDVQKVNVKDDDLFGSRRLSHEKGIKCWSVGKGGQTSTTVGSRNVL